MPKTRPVLSYRYDTEDAELSNRVLTSALANSILQDMFVKLLQCSTTTMVGLLAGL